AGRDRRGQARAPRVERACPIVAPVEPQQHAAGVADVDAARLWRRPSRPALLLLHPGTQPVVTGCFSAGTGASVSTVSNAPGSVISMSSRSSECATSAWRMPGG